MAYHEYTPFLKSGNNPKRINTESQYGNEFVYIHAASETLPEVLIGEIWSDGLTVTSAPFTQNVEGSELIETTVSTVYTRSTGSGDEDEATLEQEKYSMRGGITQVELAMHPDFLPGGASDLYTTAVTSGTMTEIPLVFVMSWENEPNPVVKGQRKFYERDADGKAKNPGTPISVPSGAATAYVKLRQLGFTTKDVYNPIWQRIRTYKGKNAPVSAIEGWGQYVAGASVPGLPTAVSDVYPDFIKTKDDLDQIGDAGRWQRVEEWTGYTAVYFDVDTLNPAGRTLP